MSTVDTPTGDEPTPEQTTEAWTGFFAGSAPLEPAQVVSPAGTPDEMERLRGEVRLLGHELAAEQARLGAYKQRVREMAIRVRNDQGDWCLDGLNEVLAELDLEPHRPGWEVTVTLRARFDCVRATSPHAAVDQVREYLQVSTLDDASERLTAYVEVDDTNVTEEDED